MDGGPCRPDGECFENILVVKALESKILRSSVSSLGPIVLDLALEMTPGVLKWSMADNTISEELNVSVAEFSKIEGSGPIEEVTLGASDDVKGVIEESSKVSSLLDDARTGFLSLKRFPDP